MELGHLSSEVALDLIAKTDRDDLACASYRPIEVVDQRVAAILEGEANDLQAHDAARG